MGFVVFLVIGVYLLVSFGVVAWAVNHALDRGKHPIPWAVGAALVMFLIPCWDWIPTIVAHKYYCEKEAGFWVYKTLDQWKAGNPGGMEGVVAYKGAPSTRQGDMENYTDTYLLNQRISKIVQQSRVLSWLTVHRHEQTVVDSKTSEVLARYIDFGSYNREWGGLRFWTSIQHCSDRGTHPQHQFYEFENQLTGR